jgi:hypothetical protein
MGAVRIWSSQSENREQETCSSGQKRTKNNLVQSLQTTSGTLRKEVSFSEYESAYRKSVMEATYA